jgi:hypothetical protein
VTGSPYDSATFPDDYADRVAIPANSIGLPTTDTFTIGQDDCPGRCELTAGGVVYGWDERKGWALTGATLVPVGDPLNEYGFRVYLWTGTQYAAWLAFAAKYLSAAVKYLSGTTTPRALSIYHRVLAAPPFSVTEVVVGKVGVPVEDDDGGWTVEITFRQYRKPQPALGKGEAAIPAAANPTPTANDKAEAEFAGKGAEFAKLAGTL